MTTDSQGGTNRQLRVAVIGAGPAGFYTADALLKRKDVAAEIDLFDRLPAPYGLVRYGVAPDHQKIKSVTAAYDKVLQNPSVRFFGNVHVGYSVAVEELLPHYDALVFAVGCETDRRLGIPGEDLIGSHAATSFVAWYNGHPDFRDYAVHLETKRAVVVGVGDVAMDLARMLLKTPEALAGTDVAEHALAIFRKNAVEEVVVLARRGPAQAAFASKELEDIAELPDVDVVVDGEHVRQDLAAGDDLDGLTRRKLDYLATLASTPPKGAPKRLVLRFLASPVELVGEGDRVVGLKIEENALVRGSSGVSARGTGRFETLETGLVLRSVGYKGVAIPGVPFDEKAGIVPNTDGRVLRAGAPWEKVYVAGWIKRGPSGVIGTNKSDAAGTVELVVADAAGRPAAEHGPRSAVPDLLAARGVRAVTASDWKALDAIERERGKAVGKVREKIVRVDEMLAALSRPSG